jgi:hypothetical protein
MSEQQLRDLIAFASDFSERHFAAKGVIHPMWHAFTSSGEQFIEAPPFDDKDLAAAMIRALFDLRDVVRYVFIDEAWTVERPITDDEYRTVQRIGLSNFPGRSEIVMFSGEDREYGGMITAKRSIIRPKGKPYLGPLVWDERYTHSEGRMVGMLPARGPKH